MLVGQVEEWPLFNTCIVDVKYQAIFGLKIYMLSILAMLSQPPASQDRTVAFIGYCQLSLAVKFLFPQEFPQECAESLSISL
jgi:hypothetical protein